MKLLQIQTSRFGVIEVTEKELITFPEGLLGFEDQKQYALLPIPQNPYFYCLQSTTDKHLAFLLVDPFIFFPDYQFDLDDSLLARIKVSSPKQIAVLTIVTIPRSGVKDATTNLVGPLIINLEERIGLQVVLEGAKYNTKHLLFTKENNKKTALHGSR